VDADAGLVMEQPDLAARLDVKLSSTTSARIR